MLLLCAFLRRRGLEILAASEAEARNGLTVSSHRLALAMPGACVCCLRFKIR
jgi:hypothetical protein